MIPLTEEKFQIIKFASGTITAFSSFLLLLYFLSEHAINWLWLVILLSHFAIRYKIDFDKITNQQYQAILYGISTGLFVSVIMYFIFSPFLLPYTCERCQQ